MAAARRAIHQVSAAVIGQQLLGQRRSHPGPDATHVVVGEAISTHDGAGIWRTLTIASPRGLEPAADFLLGFIKIHVLHHAAKEPVYGLALIRELQRHGYDLSPGTLYPILHGLEAAGYLRHEERLVNGRIRKYYAATARGQYALEQARPAIRELVEEVVEDRGPQHLDEPFEADSAPAG